jgi:hypothetical protein
LTIYIPCTLLTIGQDDAQEFAHQAAHIVYQVLDESAIGQTRKNENRLYNHRLCIQIRQGLLYKIFNEVHMKNVLDSAELILFENIF